MAGGEPSPPGGGPPNRTASSPGSEDTLTLLRRARAGETAAIERLCARFLPVLRRWARGRLPPPARDLLDTDDLVQETLLHTFSKLQGFEPRHDGALQAYLRQAVRNRIRDEVRRSRRGPGTSPLGASQVDPRPSPLEEAIGQETLERYEAALDRLGEEDRHAIVLRIEMGYTHEQLADVLGKPSPDAARMAISRALVRLAEEMVSER